MLERSRIVKHYPYPLKHRIYSPEKREIHRPLRKLQAKSMTIAAAFVCSDGIVLAADSEYTYNYSKYEGRKIFGISKGDWSMVIAGAGTMDLVKMVIDDFGTEFEPSDNMRSLRSKIVARAKYFSEEYLSKGQEQRQLLLFVAIQMRSGENTLLKVAGDLVVSVEGCDFIGAGDEVARVTSSWLYSPSMTTEVMMRIAMQIVYFAKEHAQYCGKTTYVVALPKTWGLKQRTDIFHEKDFFWGLHELVQPIIVGCVDTKIPEQQFETSLARFDEKMREVRRAFIQADALLFPLERSTAEPGPRGPNEINPSFPTSPERQP